MRLIVPEWEDLASHVGALMTTRVGGFSVAPFDDGIGGGGCNLGLHVQDDPVAVARNRAQLARLVPSAPAWLSQVHGTVVVDAGTVDDAPEADASVSDQPGVVCAIMTADCLPVLLADAAGKVVGAAHAGWRGLVDGVLENTVAAMHARGAVDISAWMGPAIGAQMFEVGEDVLAAFVAKDATCQEAFLPIVERPGKYLADIYALARKRLHHVGVTRVFGGELCTMTQSNMFYSYRRDKTTGRMAALIWLK